MYNNKKKGSLIKTLGYYHSRNYLYPASNLKSVYNSLGIESLSSSKYSSYEIKDDSDGTVPPFACSYASSSDHASLLAISDETGTVQIIDTAFRNTRSYYKALLAWKAHNNAVFDVKWSRNDKYIITASGDRTLKVWDVEQKTAVSSLTGHDGSIKCVSVSFDNPNILISAGRDGTVKMWDLRILSGNSQSTLGDAVLEPWLSLEYAHVPVELLPKSFLNALNPKKRKRSLGMSNSYATQTQKQDLSKFGVTCVEFLPHSSTQLLSSGAADGALKLWDLRVSTKIAHETSDLNKESTVQKQHGFTWLAIDSFGERVYASCTNHSVYAFRLANLSHCVSEWKHPDFRCDSFYIKVAISPDNSFIATSSSLPTDSTHSEHGNAFIWPSESLQSTLREPVILKTAPAETTCVSWNQHSLFNEYEISVGCDAAVIKTWKTDLSNMALEDSFQNLDM